MNSATRKQAMLSQSRTLERYIPGRVEEQVERTPDAPAVVFGNTSLTYNQLNIRANQLAWKLKSLGAGPDALVGISVERSLEMVVGLLGILKSGAAYVPIDPAYPKERTAYMMRDAGFSILLTQRHLRSNLPDHYAQELCLDSEWEQEIAGNSHVNPEAELQDSNLAYVIYTSGSTGQPKGAMNTHGGVCNRLMWMQQAYGLRRDDVVLQKTAFSFDVSVWEFFWPLMTGAQLVMAVPGGHQDSRYMVKLIQEKCITTVHFVPSMLRIFLEEVDLENCRSLRRVICSGEALPFDLKEKFFTRLDCELHNLYGPTEAAIDVTFWACGRNDGAHVVPIGRPIANTQVHILDADMRPVEKGAAGQVYIGGAGVGRGYWRRPELTAERFTPNPFTASSGDRLYRTGDVGREMNDGAIEYLGRTDFQVKVRGFRIELGEIESALLQHKMVKDAVVTAYEKAPGDQRLVAYVVPQDSGAGARRLDAPGNGDVEHTPEEELQEYLKGRLPICMLPSAFMLMDRLPLSPNGKIDRKALPEPNGVARGQSGPNEEPRNPAEKKIAEIWRTVLHVDHLGIHDNFFDLGGHSLLATQFLARLRHELGVDLPLPALFTNPTIAKFSAVMNQAGRIPKASEGPRATARTGDLPLSFSQERVWFVERVNPGILAYNYQSQLRFEGKLFIPALEQALKHLIVRHEICRTTVHEVGGRPIQVIHEPYLFQLPVINVQDATDPEQEVKILIEEEMQKPFNLEQLPLIYWVLFRLGPKCHVLFHKEHHMLHDGWSFNVFLNELFESYNAYAKGTAPDLPELPIQFADFAQWQRQWMEGEEAARQLNFWGERLDDSPGLLQLPWDHPRPAVPSFKGEAPRLELPLDLCEALRKISRKRGVTLFMTMFAAFLILLRRLSGAADICVGSGIANRRWKETEGLLGMMVNNVVLRADLSANPSIDDLLQQVRKITLEAYENQDIPFDRVVQALEPDRALSHNPLFQAMFSFHDSPIRDFDLPEAKVTLTETLSNHSAKWDMNIIVIPRAEQKLGDSKNEKTQGITVVWEYSSDLFDPGTMRSWTGLYQEILRKIVASQSDERVDSLPLMNGDQRSLWLAKRRFSSCDYPRNASIPELFQDQVRTRPNATAVVYEGQSLSYAELNDKANQLARYLRQRGAGPETTIGICLGRSLEMVIGLLGILKSGAAYVPIDPDYPRERRQWMVRTTAMRLMLTSNGPDAALDGVEVIRLNETQCEIGRESTQDFESGASAENLAYVIFTSGSTGTAKGVAVHHRGVVRLVKAANYVELGPRQRILQFAPLSFDASILEIWGAFLNGATLVIATAGKITSEGLGSLIRENEINTLWLTAGLFRLMVDHHLDDLREVEQLLAGGDVLSVAHVQRYLHCNTHGKLINGYGPTENTTFTCCHTVREGHEIGATVLIGKPISSTQAYVLDENLELVPPGVVGELYAGGDGLARGYIDRPDMTAEKFIPSPFSATAGERLYRTGDLARYRSNGFIEFLGRKDQQVKIHGFRVELGEIESVLRQHAEVRESVVLAEEDGAREKRLVAYVMTEQGIGKQQLRAYLKEKLPEYMLPAVVIPVKEIPLTANGKIDRNKLSQHGAQWDEHEVREHQPIPPLDELEQMIEEVWTDLLKVDCIPTHESFFDAGGHSLLLMRMIFMLNAQFGVNLGLRGVLETPTIPGLAHMIASARRYTESNGNPILRRHLTEAPASFAQRSLYFMKHIMLQDPVYNMPVAHRLRGKLDVTALQASVNAIVRRHEILRTHFREVEGEAVQVVEPEMPIRIETEDLSGVSALERENTLTRRLHEEARCHFNLSRVPLLRLWLFRTAPDDYVLLIVMHHIIIDGWSLHVFYQELEALYAASPSGTELKAKPLPIQYSDYALWQRERLERGELDDEMHYWTNKLVGAPEVLTLEPDDDRPDPPNCVGTTERFEFDEATTAALKHFALRSGVTLHMTLLAACAVLLHRISGQDEMVIGVPAANRSHEPLRELIGFFVNMLPIRIDLRGNPTLKELARRVKETALDAYAHQEMPFERLVEKLKPGRTLHRNPLFQVVFNMLSKDVGTFHLVDIDSTPVDVDISYAKFDLYFEIHERQRRLRGRLIHSGLFAAGSGTDICLRFQQLIGQILLHEDCPIGDLDLLLQAEKSSLDETTSIEDLEESFLL
jgi:amino acid adenylation domain-containing protein